jgi:predicted Zn-dependent protease
MNIDQPCPGHDPRTGVSAAVRGVVLSIAILAIGLIGVGCANDASVISQATNMHKSLDPAVIEDQQLAGYFQKIGDRIIAAAEEADAEGIGPKAHFDKQNRDWMFGSQMQFHLVNSKTLNAFTTGGEHMYIYNELFQQCTSEDELAAVMAHEYAHVYGRHVAKGMDRRYGVLAAAAAAGVGGAAIGGKDNWQEGAAAGAGVGLLAAQFANMGFTRKDEDEADKLGFYFYTRAGWDPERFADFFQHMIDKGYDKTPAMLSDHPTLKSRVEATQRRISELPNGAERWRRSPVADTREFRRLQQRAVSLGRNLPDDTSLENSQELLQALPRSCVAPVDPEDAEQARERLARRAKASQ